MKCTRTKRNWTQTNKNLFCCRDCALLGCCAASGGNFLPIFQPIGCPETSVRNYPLAAWQLWRAQFSSASVRKP